MDEAYWNSYLMCLQQYIADPDNILLVSAEGKLAVLEMGGAYNEN
jgi:hypothetical protein